MIIVEIDDLVLKMNVLGVFMKNNKLNSALLSVLLMIPGQVLCSEPLLPVQPSIFDRLWLSVPSMPAAPEWMTNFTSGLSDTKKYFLYGAMAAFLGYIGYQVSGISFFSSKFMAVPTEIDNRPLLIVKSEQLDDEINCRNIAYITRDYVPTYNSPKRQKAFESYVCPVLNKHQEKLDSKENWMTFLTKITFQKHHRMTFTLNQDELGYKIFSLINKTCPNKNITNPLKELLIERNPRDTELLEFLNK